MSASIKIAIRADAGSSVGMGHFARMSALAEILLASGDTEVVLLTNADSKAHVVEYFPADTKVVPLALDDAGPSRAMGNLGKSGWTANVIILDQYGAVSEWEALTANTDTRLIVFDDFDVATQADLIVRPHSEADFRSEAIILGGPSYLPLSHHTTDLAGTYSKKKKTRLRLNICFGGSDPTGETEKTLQTVADLEEFEIDVVIGPGAQIEPKLVKAAMQMPNVTVHHAPNQEQLAGLMSKADLALGAGGVMLWERLCLGVPSLVIATAQNQQAQIDSMVASGAIRFLGQHEQVTPKQIVEAVQILAADKAGRSRMSEIGQNLIDGRGAVRIASWIKALALDIRKATMDDARNLLNWRTDVRNWQHNFESVEKPDWNAHVSWLAAKLADPDCIFRIVTHVDQPVGVVRFDINDDDKSAYLSIYLVPEWHGRKMGLPVYLAAERELLRCPSTVEKIMSRIHSANTASERLHREAGFEISASPDHTDWLDALKLLD